MNMPRPDYPRPQFVRDDWLCLNGPWEFEFDHGDSGFEEGFPGKPYSRTISVPFCPESALSGIGHTGFLRAVWYRRRVAVPQSWSGSRVLLHFQAVDYDATVWVNGTEVGRHRGGFTPFTCDISGAARPGETATIVVRARDYPHEWKPKGKQSDRLGNYGCLYTRTTGIWQTVWMEPTPETALLRPRVTPDVAGGRFVVEQRLHRAGRGQIVRATLYDGQGEAASAQAAADSDLAPLLVLDIPEPRRRLWGPHDPFLYDLKIELLDAAGGVVDTARSYAGLRSVSMDGPALRLNGKVVFQRLVLDQGFYPDGILTAPTDEALRRDIELSLEAGFNGARLHQKVFEERFLYHADQLGYLVWGEFADWGCHDAARKLDNQRPGATYITQWIEALERDYSHPCIVGWCPLNETHQTITDRIDALDDVTRGMFLATKAMDGTRPVLDTSGYAHRVPETDVYDCHDYDQNPETFAARHAGLAEDKPFLNGPDDAPWSVPYRGQPFFVSEFGGIWWNPEAKEGEDSWGYGERPRTVEEFYERFERLCGVLLDDPRMFGYCYTQLTDVFQEQNGIFRFDRRPKFDMRRIRAAQQRPAAIEKRP